MRRRVLTLAIAVVLICSLFTSFAFAATLRASDYISSYNAVIYSSGTKINVDCSITGTGRMKTIGIKSVKIYTSSGTNVATYASPRSDLYFPADRTGRARHAFPRRGALQYSADSRFRIEDSAYVNPMPQK